jgi:hypothetical protein
VTRKVGHYSPWFEGGYVIDPSVSASPLLQAGQRLEHRPVSARYSSLAHLSSDHHVVAAPVTANRRLCPAHPNRPNITSEAPRISTFR